MGTRLRLLAESLPEGRHSCAPAVQVDRKPGSGGIAYPPIVIGDDYPGRAPNH
jgi:hypothetical protein